MVPQDMIDKSKIFGGIVVFQNLLEKRGSLMTTSFIFDVINKMVSGQQIIDQSHEPVNYFIDHNQFTTGIACPDFNCMPCNSHDKKIHTKNLPHRKKWLPKI